MIELNRVRTAAAINETFRGEGRVDRNVQLIEGELSGDIERIGSKFFKSGVWKKAKDQLKLESFGKCAYCESPTSTVAHGDVEHYRPKSKYWWLAYCYENYLYSCQVCNQTFKSNHFPIHGTKLPEGDVDAFADDLTPDPLNDDEGAPLADFLRAEAREKAAIPNPYVRDPEALFGWVVEDVLGQVSIVARSSGVASQRASEAVTSDDGLGLNREELRIARFKVYEAARLFVGALTALEAAGGEQSVITSLRERLEEMMSARSPYAGMVRYFVLDEWDLDLMIGE